MNTASILSSFPDFCRDLSIGIQHSIHSAASPHRKVIDVRLPLVAVTLLSARARRKVAIHNIREIFGSIHGPEGKADRKELTAAGDDRKHLPCTRSINQMVESSDCIEERDVDASGYFRFNIVRASHEIHCPEGSSIHPSVVHH